MDWIVKIDGKSELRIIVRYNPVLENITFIGEFKYKSEWIEFYILVCSSYLKLNSEKIKELLFDTYNGLNNRVNVFKGLNEEFSDIKLIEINED